MKNIRIFYLKNCHFLVVKFSVYLNRRVFVMARRMLMHCTVLRFGTSAGRPLCEVRRGGGQRGGFNQVYSRETPSFILILLQYMSDSHCDPQSHL